jgi:hypothetical protein
VETVSGASSCEVYFLPMVEEHQKEGGDLGLNGLSVPAVVLFVPPSPIAPIVVTCTFQLSTSWRAESNYQIYFYLTEQQVIVQKQKWTKQKAKVNSMYYKIADQPDHEYLLRHVAK